MLSPEARTILIDDLRAPAGYQLDAAVATTFTLSLEAAILPALAFVASTVGDAESTSGTLQADPVLLLESIRAATDKMDIFCQAGLISVPTQAPDLAAFMEPMLHQMPRTRSGGLFHPKLWALRFTETNGDAALYRLLILSRNLTLDDSWDVSVRLDSRAVADAPITTNEPLVSLIRELPGSAIHPLDPARAQRVRALAGDLARVQWELPERVESLAFYRGGTGVPDTLRAHAGPVLLISPFITDDAVHTLTPHATRRIAVSREDSLDQLHPDTLEALDSTYVLDPSAEIVQDDDDPTVEGQPVRSVGHSLHAKAYVVDLTRRWTKSALILGSANATAPAFTSNEELLVEFVGPRDMFGINAVLGRTSDGEPSDNHTHTLGGFLVPYLTKGGAAPASQEREDLEFERRLLQVGEIPHVAVVTASEGDVHAVTVTTQRGYPLPEGWAAKLRLLTRPAELREIRTRQPVECHFDAIPTADLTAYVIVTLTNERGHERSATIVANLQGAPRDRWDHVLARQIDTPEKFIRYVLLLLSMDQPHLLAQLALTDASRGAGAGADGVFSPAGLLELVLRNLRHRPQAILDLNKLMRRLNKTEEGRTRIPPEVARLWPQIIKAARARKGAL